MDIALKKTLVADLVPALHQLRIATLENLSRLQTSPVPEVGTGVARTGACGGEDQAEMEVAGIMHGLMHLEYTLGEFDDLHVIKALKSTIADHMDLTATQCESTDLDVDGSAQSEMHMATLIHKQGLPLQPIRLKMVTALDEGIAQLEVDDLLLTSSPEDCGSKKKLRSVSYSTNFNFDDLPDFEPLELTLRLIREDARSIAALQKLLTLELSELIEHPQWHELLSLLYNALVACDTHTDSEEEPEGRLLTMVIHVHIRLMEALEGQQGVDIMLNLLKYFWNRWGQGQGQQRIGHPSQLGSVSKTHVRSFMYILKFCQKSISQCSEQSADLTHITIFLLLARGQIAVDGSAVVQLLDAISYLDTQCACGIEFVRSLKPVSVVTHAIHSNLLPIINQQLQLLMQVGVGEGGEGGEEGDAMETEKQAKWEDGWILRRISLISLMFFEITAPFHSKSLEALQFVTTTTLCDPQWDGSLSGPKPGRADGEGTVVLTPIKELNKLVSQVTGPLPVWQAFEKSTLEAVDEVDKRASDVSTQILSIASSLYRIVFAYPVSSREYRFSIVAFVERMLCHACLEVPIEVQEQFLSYCAALMVLLVSTEHEQEKEQEQEYEHKTYVPASDAAGAHEILRKYLIQLSSTTICKAGDSSHTCIYLSAWTSATKLCLDRCPTYKIKNIGSSKSTSMTELYAVNLLMCQLLAGWQALLQHLHAFTHTEYSKLGLHILAEDGSLSAHALTLTDVVEFAAGYAKWRYQDTVEIDPDSQVELTVARSTCVMHAVSLLVTITSCSEIVETTLIARHDLAREVVEVLIKCIVGDGAMIGETSCEGGSAFQGTALFRSIIVMCDKFGAAIILESPAWHSLVSFVTQSTSDSFSYDLAESWYEAGSSLSTTLELLCGLIFAGHEALVFPIVREAWEPLQQLCEKQEHCVVDSFTVLFGLGETVLGSLKSESFYTLLLRLVHVALCSSASFVCDLQSLSATSSRGDDTEGMDAHSLFWSVLHSRVNRSVQAAHTQYWCPFFLPFSEDDVTRASQWAAQLSTVDVNDPTVVPVRLSVSSPTAASGSLSLMSLNSLSTSVDLETHAISSALASQIDGFLSLAETEDAGVATASQMADAVLSYTCAGSMVYSPLLRDMLVIRDVNPIQGSGERINWLVVSSHLVGMTSSRQFVALLQRVGAESEAALHSRVEQLAISMLRKYRMGTVHHLFARLGVSSEVLVRSIIRQWFFPYLCLDDVALVTASTWISGPDQAALVAVTILIQLADILRIGALQGWGSVGGTEAVVRAMCSPTFAKFRISNSKNSVIIAELTSS